MRCPWKTEKCRYKRETRVSHSCRGRSCDDWLSDSDDDYDDGYRGHGRPRYLQRPPVTDIVVKDKKDEPGKAKECQYKCCPCHAEKAKAAAACACHHKCACGQLLACQPAAKATGADKKADEAKDRILIDVVDRTDGPLARRHGSRYPVSIAPKATVQDIVAMLAPDRRLYRIEVRWNEWDWDDLESLTSLDDLRRYPARLYIKERKPRRVRFS